MKQTLSFRLLTEYYSFLSTGDLRNLKNKEIVKFPSPYGVLFILMIR